MRELTPEQRATADAIERALERIPVARPHDHGAAPSCPTEASTFWTPPARGAYPCRLDCGAILERPGMCDACAPAKRYAEALEQFTGVLAAIPVAYRRPPDADLRRICNEFLRGLDACAMVDQVTSGIIERKCVVYTLLDPRSGKGKSTFAGSVIDEIVARAIRAIRDAQPPERGRAEPYVVSLARGARFVSAAELIRMWGDGEDARPPKYELARTATILVLDDAGSQQECKADSGATSARNAAVARLLESRWKRGRPTLVPTYQTYTDAVRAYGGGTARRLYKDNVSTCVIPCNMESSR